MAGSAPRATLTTKTNLRKRTVAEQQPKPTSPKRAKKENKAPVSSKDTPANLTSAQGSTNKRPIRTSDEHQEDKPTAKRAKREHTETPAQSSAPYVPENPLNALPLPPAHGRPSPQLFFWGAGNFGQFGMGPDVLGEFDKPRKHSWVENGITEKKFGRDGAGIELVVAGGMHTLFTDELGRVWSCGVNDDAALGRSFKDVPDPENPGQFMSVDVLASYPFILKTLEEEKFRVVRLAAGDNIGAAVSDDGSLKVWGTFKSKEGSLGFSEEHKHQWEPVSVVPKVLRGRPEACVDVACGSNHVLALTTTGDVFAWGEGEHGQLGRKILERKKIHGVTPERVVIGSRSRRITAIAAGFYTSFAIDSDGDVWAWGLNNMGQTGTTEDYDGDELVVVAPKHVVALSPERLEGEKVVSITSGEHHTIFLTSGGRVFACGRAEGGQLGLDEAHPVMVERRKMLDGKAVDIIITPTEVTFPVSATEDPIVHIQTGVRNNLAASRDGALYSWGEGNQGELGLGEDETNANVPTVVVRRAGGSWRAIGSACGGQHTIGLFVKRS